MARDFHKQNDRIAAILGHRTPLADIVTFILPATPKPTPDKLSLHDHVTYTRTNGDVVRGFIDDIDWIRCIIFNTSTGAIIAAPRNRVNLKEASS